MQQQRQLADREQRHRRLSSIFLGNILANTSITFATGANGTGSLYAHTGAVTLDTSHITTCDGTEIPPPPPLGISTTPSGNGAVGGTISDSATISGGLSPSGDVTFKLFGPADPNCTGPFTSRPALVDARTASSGDVAVTAEGTYDWVATYNGDANNGPADLTVRERDGDRHPPRSSPDGPTG